MRKHVGKKCLVDRRETSMNILQLLSFPKGWGTHSSIECFLWAAATPQLEPNSNEKASGGKGVVHTEVQWFKETVQ